MRNRFLAVALAAAACLVWADTASAQFYYYPQPRYVSTMSYSYSPTYTYSYHPGWTYPVYRAPVVTTPAYYYTPPVLYYPSYGSYYWSAGYSAPRPYYYSYSYYYPW